MYLLRPIKMADLKGLLLLSEEAGTGMSTMPLDERTWCRRILKSKRSFLGQLEADEEGVYFMVLEDLKSGELLGTTAVYSHVGFENAFYSYRLSYLESHSQSLNVAYKTRTLSLVNDFHGSTELGSLFLKRSARHSHLGQFLSRARYLLMADFPDAFDDMLIAELRGCLDEDGKSPFWSAVGAHFIPLTFREADYMTTIRGTQMIADLMPRHPLYIELLPPEAQEVIGKAHEDSCAALHLLHLEGFYYSSYVDVFDAGPCYVCPRNKVTSIKDSRTVKLSGYRDTTDKLSIISNRKKGDYRLLLAPVSFDADRYFLKQSDAQSLGLFLEDDFSLLTLREKGHA